jgi:hypothetical protein
VPGHSAQRGGPVVEDRCDQHRRCVRDADHRSCRLGARARRALGGAAAAGVAPDSRLVSRRSGWATYRWTGPRARSRVARRSA